MLCLVIILQGRINKQAGIYLGRSEQSIRHLIFSRDLPVVRVGRRVHLHRRDLLTDDQYTTLQDALPPELRSLFVCAYITGMYWPKSQWVFSREGKRILDFRRSWKTAVTAAGVPDLRFHDLRRTAVRNKRRAGVPQVVRMKISGHKTDSMERRYNIVDTEDLTIAKRLMEVRMRKKSE